MTLTNEIPIDADNDPLLRDLTEEQRRAVVHVDGPLLIIAAAGSGKTRVITRRVAHLMRVGIQGPSILALTFTNKAAGEMKQRISALSPRPLRDWGRLDQPWPIICTFHSLCLRVLKHYAPQLGLPVNFTIYDSADQTKLIKEAIKALDLSSQYTPSSVHPAISNAKNELMTANDFSAKAQDFYQKNVARIFTKYESLLKLNNAMDFDDLLVRTAHAMRDHPKILAELQERFKYLLIDEYQDTNHAQYMIAHMLAMHNNICVVGDPDQSIYGWRGADIRNILGFEKDYPNATIVKLEQNYRSTKTILAIAEKLISFNRQRKEKRLWTENAQGEKATVLVCQSEHHEATEVAKLLHKLHDRDGYDWGKMAVFYRMNSLSRVMEDALRKAGIPYQIARGVAFYNRKEIKDVLAYLRAIANPNDEVSLERIINVPTRGIGDASVKLMQAYGASHGLSLWEAMRQPTKVEGLSTRAINSITQFTQLIESFRRIQNTAAAGDGIFESVKGIVQTIMEDVIYRSGYEAMLKKEDPDEENEIPNVNELISAAREYDLENPEGSLDDYLTRVALVSDADHVEGAGGSVTMMTLHAAKGLEFPVVAMIGMEEGCLPHARVMEHPGQLEEERRLCFVGITRSEERLILSTAKSRMIRGKTEWAPKSQFLGQMPRELLDVQEPFDDSAPQLNFEVGQKVRHPNYGIGRIVDVSGTSDNTKAIIDFSGIGRKTFVLQSARLTVIR